MKTMTSRERILAATKGQETDMVPVSPRLFAYLLDKYGEHSLESNLKFQTEYDFDITLNAVSGLANPIFNVYVDTSYSKDIKLEMQEWEENGIKIVKRVFHTPAGKIQDIAKVPPSGCGYGIAPDPTKIEWLIKDRSDLEKIAYILPDPKKHCDISNLKKLNDTMGEKGLIQTVIHSPIDYFAGDARGMENLMIDYYEDKEFFDDIIKLFYDHIMCQTKVCLENGFTNIFGCWYYTSLSSGWSPKIFREEFIPLMKEHVNLVHKYDGTYDLYDDGKCMSVLEDYVNTGADVLETITPPPVGDVDLAEAKRIVGNKMTLKGYTDLIYVLQMGTPEQVRDTVMEAIRIAGPGGRFILGTSDSIRDGTPEENVRVYFETARKYGKYPL
ncbi:MAG: hypothetical protein GX800_05060 [Clostridiaceae bacterium]|nr:hypothetical protein [Clostridiaceae bacterium]